MNSESETDEADMGRLQGNVHVYMSTILVFPTFVYLLHVIPAATQLSAA